MSRTNRTTTSPRFLLFLCGFALLASISGPAAAQEEVTTQSDEDARLHFESGRLHFERGEYDVALREFEGAYELSGRVGLLYNIYLTLERLGRLAEAADRLEQFLLDDPSIEPERRANLESRMSHLRARAAEAATPDPDPAPVPTPRESGGAGLHELGVAGVVTLATGGASLVVFAITGGLALAEDGALSERCGPTAGALCGEDDVSGLRTLVAISDATLAIGLILAAAGGTMLAIDLATGSAPEDRAVSLAPMLGPDLVGLTLGGAL